MKLLIDIGNTRVKWAILESGHLGESDNFIRSKTGIKASLNSHWKKLENISDVFVSNVAGETIAQQLEDWTKKHWEISPTFVKSESKKFGVTNAYDQPDQLGVDRWLALIAVRQHARQATCLIDCGTAITIDTVTKNGLHQGGLILPGLDMIRDALTKKVDISDTTTEISEFQTLATNTYSAIQAGTLYTITASLNQIINDLRIEYDNKIRFIITGGSAETILPLLPEKTAHYPDVVLKGLAYYARQGDKKPHTNKTIDIKQDEPPILDDTEQLTNAVESVELPKQVG